MLALLLLIAVGFVAWRFMAPGQRFLPDFARLLTGSSIQRGPFSVFTGLSYATGTFQGRDVAVRLQLKRNRYGQGYLVIALRVGGPPALDYNGIDDLAQGDTARRALSVLAANDLLISVEVGWLKALWRPQGFVIFPGRCEVERWRRVLAAMQDVAVSLEAAAPRD